MQDYQNHRKFEEAVSYLPDNLGKLLLYLPPDQKAQIHEVRLRVERPLAVCTGNRTLFVSERGGLGPVWDRQSYLVTREDLQNALRTLCQFSVHSHLEEMREGYIAIPGGHRAGICGTAVGEGERLLTIRDISSVNLRICRQVDGCADELLERTLSRELSGVLIAGPPGSGKTTLLRDIARQLSSGYQGVCRKVAVVDERGEIGSAYGGVPQCDIGICSDLLSGYPKAEGMITAIRTLSPELIICDEIASRQETEAVRYCLNSGVSVITTVHAFTREELLRRPQSAELLRSGAFSQVVLLKGAHNPCAIAQIWKAGDLYAAPERNSPSGRLLCPEREPGVPAAV